MTYRILDRRVESWAEFLYAWLWKPHNGKEQLYLNILSRAVNHNSNCGRVLLSRNIHSGSARHFLRFFKFLRAVIQHICLNIVQHQYSEAQFIFHITKLLAVIEWLQRYVRWWAILSCAYKPSISICTNHSSHKLNEHQQACYESYGVIQQYISVTNSQNDLVLTFTSKTLKRV